MNSLLIKFFFFFFFTPFGYMEQEKISLEINNVTMEGGRATAAGRVKK
jgi:hypothetical protein